MVHVFYVSFFIFICSVGNGSDAGAALTMAKKIDDGYMLNGSKCWITNGYESEAAIIFATTDKSKKHKGISAFVIEKPRPGLQKILLTVFFAHFWNFVLTYK